MITDAARAASLLPWFSAGVLAVSVVMPFLVYRVDRRRADAKLNLFLYPVWRVIGASIYAAAGVVWLLLGLALVRGGSEPVFEASGWGLIIMAFTPISPLVWMAHLSKEGREERRRADNG